MGVQPSASRTELLLACPRPFEDDTKADDDSPGEAARYGSAFHQVIAACLRSGSKGKKPLERTAAYVKEVERAADTFDVKDAQAELAGHVKGSVKVLRNWLEREKLQVAEIEVAYAVRPQAGGTWTVRGIPPFDGDHRYKVDADEVPCTVDLIARSANRRRVVVIDHKTGAWGEPGEFALPVRIPQMRTLGLVPQGKVETELGIFHADRLGLPAMYADPYERPEQKRHVAALRAALDRIGHGFLRPGDQCERCKARTTCPAKAAELLGEGAAVLVESTNKLAVEPVDPQGILLPPEDGLTVEQRAGAIYDLLKRFRKIEKAASEEIKRLVRDGAVIETREGKVLGIQTQRFETVSKKSILAAFGKIKGEKELRRLRAAGALNESTREMLVQEK